MPGGQPAAGEEQMSGLLGAEPGLCTTPGSGPPPGWMSCSENPLIATWLLEKR